MVYTSTTTVQYKYYYNKLYSTHTSTCFSVHYFLYHVIVATYTYSRAIPAYLYIIFMTSSTLVGAVSLPSRIFDQCASAKNGS